MFKVKFISAKDFFVRVVVSAVLVAVIAAIGAAFLFKNFNFLFPSFVIIGGLSLGLLVLFKGGTRKINTSFFLLCFVGCFWTFSVYMYSEAFSADTALFWSRMATSAASFVPVIVVYFTSVFPKEDKIPTSIHIIIWFIISSVFAVLSFTDLIVTGVVSSPHGFVFKRGIGLLFYLAYVLSFMVYAFYELLRKHNHYTGISRLQIRYVFLGFFLGSSFPIATNLILPLLGVTAFSYFGPYFTVIAIAIITYSIVKHRLMSIELVIQRGLIYAILTASIVGLYALAITISERMFQGALGYSSFVTAGIVAAIIAVLYQPFLKVLQDMTDRIFFRWHYDYQKTLKEASSAIASIIRLPRLTKLIVATFTETLAVSEISFLLYDKIKRRYRSVAIELKGASRYRKMEINEDDPIIRYLREKKEILVSDELENRILRAKSGYLRDTLKELKERMDRIGIPLWVPIVFKDELLAVIASGGKLSGEVFTAEDFGLISTLANQTAVGLDNARLYEEILSMKTYSEEILQSMTNGVLTTDLNGKVITFNAMAADISGYKADEVVGQGVSKIWGDGVLPSVIEGTVKGKLYSNFETKLIKKDGRIIPVSVSTTLLKNNKGENIGVLAVFSDLSDVKELEGKVRQADKLAALGTMAAGMAHEIKNPLSSMKVLSQLMPLKFGDNTFRKRFTDIMPREIGRIDRIVESLLGFARATAPKLEKTELDKIIDETLSFFEDDMKKKKIKLEKKFEKVPPIIGDAGQISQVFTNLILNAVQAMGKGGVLKIDLREGKKKEGVVEGVEVVISDTGHGIPEEYSKKLFDPFFTTKHGGTGLGLTISHSIIDGHKGTISVKSEAGKGTTFKITLPLTQQ